MGENLSSIHVKVKLLLAFLHVDYFDYCILMMTLV